MSEWLDADEMIDRYLAEPEQPRIIDLSGGSPDLVPEWIAWTMDALRSREMTRSVYLWSDDNLSSDLLVQPSQSNLLREIERYEGYGRVCCLKGFDKVSFAFTTGASEEGFERQLEILKQYSRTSIDLYGYITLACPLVKDIKGRVQQLLDRLQAMSPEFVRRIVPLRIEQFSPMLSRMNVARSEGLKYQDEVASVWVEELSSRSIRPIWTQP
ncbi:hypothetical protein ACQ86E_11800 [Bradyrhizobium betae]|uniref:hypothetical protein n=1 Tax=Bradyrhizobium betae TaxID=244734 RepID=UPI003D67FF11